MQAAARTKQASQMFERPHLGREVSVSTSTIPVTGNRLGPDKAIRMQIRTSKNDRNECWLEACCFHDSACCFHDSVVRMKFDAQLESVV